MMRALYTAASGMRAQQTNVDNISNNIANVNTTAFKSQKTEFKSLLYQTIQTRTTSANGEEKPIGAQVGLGTRVASNTTSYTQGALLEDESKSAFATALHGYPPDTLYFSPECHQFHHLKNPFHLCPPQKWYLLHNAQSPAHRGCRLSQ
mgnify:CR=1 FL=1